LQIGIGIMDFTIEYREGVTDPWSIAGVAQYQFGAGWLGDKFVGAEMLYFLF